MSRRREGEPPFCALSPPGGGGVGGGGSGTPSGKGGGGWPGGLVSGNGSPGAEPPESEAGPANDREPSVRGGRGGKPGEMNWNLKDVNMNERN